MANRNEMTRVKALEYVMNNYEDMPDDVYDKLASIKASIEKKSTNSGKTKKETQADEFVKEEIIDLLTIQEKLKVTDILNSGEFSDYEKAAGKPITAQKITAVLTKMVNEDKTVIKTVDKKVSYFSLAAYTPWELAGEVEEAEERGEEA